MCKELQQKSKLLNQIVFPVLTPSEKVIYYSNNYRIRMFYPHYCPQWILEYATASIFQNIKQTNTLIKTM